MYEQLTLSLPDKLETFYIKGARYAKLTSYLEIDKSPIQLGNKMVSPGQYVKQLGRKGKRASFSMQQGCYLRYIGKSEKFLLFGVNDCLSEYCYAFAYISPTRLLVVGYGSAYDIILDEIEIFNELPNDARKFFEDATQ